MAKKRDNSDYTKSRRAAALGARLRRLSEQIDTQASLAYADRKIKFEQRWFGVLNQIVLAGPISVTEIAEKLGITHVSVSQSRASLERAGLIESTADKNDKRRKLLSLTPKGRKFVERLRPTWEALEKAAIDLEREASGVIDALDRLENALERQSLIERVRDYHD